MESGDDALPHTIDVALNEATWLGLALRPERHELALSFDVFTLPGRSGRRRPSTRYLGLADGKENRRVTPTRPLGRQPGDRRRRVARRVTGRCGVVWWSADLWLGVLRPARIVLVSLAKPSQSRRWWAKQPARHSLYLFKEGRRDGEDRHLDLRAWFGVVDVYDEHDTPIPLDDFAAGGKRWWDGFHAGDERTTRFGLHRLKKDQEND